MLSYEVSTICSLLQKSLQLTKYVQYAHVCESLKYVGVGLDKSLVLFWLWLSIMLLHVFWEDLRAVNTSHLCRALYTGFLSTSWLCSSFYWLFRIPNSIALLYVFEPLHLYAVVITWKFRNLFILDIPGSRLKNRGDRSLTVVAANLWNKLPLL